MDSVQPRRLPGRAEFWKGRLIASRREGTKRHLASHDVVRMAVGGPGALRHYHCWPQLPSDPDELTSGLIEVGAAKRVRP